MILKIAWNQTKHRPTRLVAVLLAIAIGTGFAAAAAVFSSTSGKAIEKAIAEPLTRADVVVRPPGDYGKQNLDSPGSLLNTITDTSGISAVASIAFISLQLENGTTINAQADPGPRLRTQTLTAGAWPSADNQVVLGTQTTKSADVHIGEKITVSDQGGAYDVNASMQLQVVGLVKEPTSTLVNSGGRAIVTPQLATASETNSYTNAIIIRAKDPAAAVRTISAAIGAKYTVQTGEQARIDAVNQLAGGTSVIYIILGTFAAIALVVASIVIANTFTILLTQRRRQIALQRLVGASSKQVRRQILVEAGILGLVGTTIGCALGIGVAAFASSLAGLGVPLQLPIAGLATSFVVGVIVTVLSAVIPSARVTRIAPIAALRPEEASIERTGLGRARSAISFVLVILGGCMLGYGVLVGSLLIAVAGGLLAVVGIVLGAQLIVVPCMRLINRIAARGTVGRLAGGNVLRHPARTTSTVVALLVGVGLIVTLEVAAASARASVLAQVGADNRAAISSILDVMTTIATAMLAVSAVIAVVGVANTLTLSIIERQAESSLVRALGLRRGQLRRMLTIEGLLIAVCGTVIGLALGVGFGLAGASAAMGERSLVVSIPWLQLFVVIIAAVAGGLIASFLPSRRAAATSLIPAEAI